MRLRDVMGCALLFASISCAKETKAPPAGPAAPAPAPAPAPVAPAPDAGVATAPAPVPVKSETQTALEALNAASTPEATDAALAGLRKAVDAAPAAPELADAAKALAKSAVARIAAVAGEVDAAKRIASVLLDASGALPAPIRAALGADADGALTVAKSAAAWRSTAAFAPLSSSFAVRTSPPRSVTTRRSPRAT